MGYNSKQLKVKYHTKDAPNPKPNPYKGDKEVNPLGNKSYIDPTGNGMRNPRIKALAQQFGIPITIPGQSMGTDGYNIPLRVTPNYADGSQGPESIIHPNTGDHSFPRAVSFTERSMGSGGQTNSDIARAILEDGMVYGHSLSDIQREHMAEQAGYDIDENGNIVEAEDADDSEMENSRRGGQKRKRKKTSSNPVTGINDLMMRNETIYGQSGKRRFVPKLEQGGWLDKYQVAGQVPRIDPSLMKQSNVASATDSFNVYNSAIQSKDFYDKLSQYYQTPEINEITKKSMAESLLQDFDYTKKKHLESSGVTDANKNIIRENKDPNIEYFSDLVTGAIDPRAPLIRYDRRIKPDGVISYKALDEYKGSTALDNLIFSKGAKINPFEAYFLINDDRASKYTGTNSNILKQKAKQEALSKELGMSISELQALSNSDYIPHPDLPGVNTSIPYYNPIEVKPWDLRTPQEKIEFVKTHPEEYKSKGKVEQTKSTVNQTLPVKENKWGNMPYENTSYLLSESKPVAVAKPTQAPVAWQPKPVKPTGPTKYQTSGGGKNYYNVNGNWVSQEDYNNSKYTEVDRTTGLPIGQQPVTKKQMGGWLDNYK
jgi:hypothetical protein